MDQEGFPPPSPVGGRGSRRVNRTRLVQRQRRHLAGAAIPRPGTPDTPRAADSDKSDKHDKHKTSEGTKGKAAVKNTHKLVDNSDHHEKSRKESKGISEKVHQKFKSSGDTLDSSGELSEKVINKLESSEEFTDNAPESHDTSLDRLESSQEISEKTVDTFESSGTRFETSGETTEDTERSTDYDDTETELERSGDRVIIARARSINTDETIPEESSDQPLYRWNSRNNNSGQDSRAENEGRKAAFIVGEDELETQEGDNKVMNREALRNVVISPSVDVDNLSNSSKQRGSGSTVLVSSGVLHRTTREGGRIVSARVQSADRMRRVNNSPRSASSPRGFQRAQQSPRDFPQKAAARVSNKSPRENSVKIIKANDASLKLSLKGLNDSEDDSEENASPRKEGSASPRKGLMSPTKSFQAKTATFKRRESDGVLIRTRSFVTPLRSESAERIQPSDKIVIKSVSKNEVRFDLSRTPVSNENSESSSGPQQTPGRPLRRTSSGRKLPIPVEKRPKSIVKSESESSFLSIRKDGSTEYVALDLTDNVFVQNKASQTDTMKAGDQTVITSDTKMATGPRPSETNTETVLRRKPSGRQLLTRSISVGTEFPISRGTKNSKPPLEKRTSRGSLSGAIPPSPRSGLPASPRKPVVAASPRGTSPRTAGSPRTQPSPRTVATSKTATRDSNSRRSSIESKKHAIEKVPPESIKHKIRKNSDSDHTINGEVGESKGRRNSGSHVSPRSSKGVRAVHGAEGSSWRSGYVHKEEESPRHCSWHGGCQNMDLKDVIAMYATDSRQARSETEVASEKTWMDAERVWLVHKGGFASASQLKGEGHGLPEGRVKIRLDHGGEVLEVDEDDVEKANPPQLDRVEDLCLLRYLNESSSLHTVRQRYGGNLIHSYAGPSLIVVNPMQPLQIYSDKVIQMFKGCKQEDMPPHIFATAQIAYREMLNTRHDQSIVMTGRSGSGKTYNAHHVLHYLAMGAGSVGNILSVDKLSAISLLLEAFGNSRTILNTSASRFSQMTTLDFDHSGQIVSASVQVLLFEKTRVVRRPEGEPTFHVFYQLLAGVDSKLRSELQLNSLSEPNLFMTPLQKTEDKQRAAQYWSRIYAAMENVGVGEEEIKSICSVLAAIYHLGVAGAVKGNNNKGQFARPAGAQRASALLGITVEELARNIFSSSSTASLTRNTSVRNSPADKSAEAHTTAMEALEGFVIGLYSDVFNAIVSLINRSLSSNFRTSASILLVDTPGFQNPATCGRQSGASFEDLCHNYTQEKLQLLFHDLTFTTPQDRYSQENIECDFEFVTTSPAAMVALIEKAPQQTLLQKSRPSSYHERRSYHDDDNVFTYTTTNHGHEPHSKVKGQGHTHADHNGAQRNSSSGSYQGFMSKIPVKVVTSNLKSYQHLCHQVGHRGSHGNHHSSSSDHEEVRTATPEVRESEKKGLLWILDEEAIFPGATEDSFMDRFFGYHGEQKVKRDSLLRKASSLGNTFILNHYQGTNPVQYNASGWLKVCRENPVSKIATQVLQDSKKSYVKELFNSVKAPVGGMVSGSIVGMEGSNTLRRVGSMRRTFMSGTAGLKKRSMCLQVKFQVDTIIETLRKTKCHFVHCILPQANAGLCELRGPADASGDKPEDNILMNVPLVRAQFRGTEILEAVRIHRQGFPDHIIFGEFIQKFTGLIPPNVRPTPDMGEKSAVIQIVENLDIDKHNYRIGLSRVFFRAGALNRLESSRDDRVTGRITGFQAYCRGFLARKRLEKLRVQHVAISCIQKNVRKFYQIRDWDWWKLYIKVKPLLNVHRTEEELADRELELEQMKTKLDRVEKERNDYKQQADKLENRVVELTADLAEENTTATQASEMLETESAERMRLEKELKDVQSRYTALKRTHEKMEMEMTQIKLWQAEAVDGELLDDDDADGGIYKERYERVIKELAVTKKKLQQQHEEELDQEKNSKRSVEKRLHEAMEEVDDLRRQLTSAKKKQQKLVSEAQDSKLHLEEQLTRNNDLERKQRKFDAELHKTQDEAKTERAHKEKLQRERDELAAEKFTLEKDVRRLKDDVDSHEVKYERIQRELGDTLQSSGAKDDHSLHILKKAKADLEAKCLDQEEELDDQAGQIQQLQQTKTRLEMNLEKSRQQHMKELEEKEQEMEDLRYSTQKKLKQSEAQMEEEYEERKLQVQKNRDLEQQLLNLQGEAVLRDKDAEKRVRRDLRRTKALLRDAQVVIQKQKTGEGSKMAVRQLRNQLEDLEFTSAAATKAKKTMELELADLQQQLDELFKAKQEAENKMMVLMREKADAQSQLEENEEDMSETLKKYKAVVQQQSVTQITMNDQLAQIEELTTERDKLRAEVGEMKVRLQTMEENSVDKTAVLRLENKIKDLENRLDLETSTKHRLEVQSGRLKDQHDKLTEEKDSLSSARTQTEENTKRVQRQLRDLREEFSDTQKKEMEAAHKVKENENRVNELEADLEQNQSDLKLAFKRIADLQSALEDGIDSDDDDDLSDSDLDDSDSDIDSFLASHNRAPLGGHRRGSLELDPRSTRLESASSYLSETPSNSSLTNNIDHSDA